MNLLYKISNLYIPTFLKKNELLYLFRITASAFEKSIPPLSGLSFEECLVEYAHFTKSEVDQLIIRHEDLQTTKDRLYQSAYQFGDKFRRLFHVASVSDVFAVSRLLYRVLRIEFQGTDQNTITISKCFFSKIYSPSTCHVISALDAGMIAGLSGGGEISFSERITEGSDCCKAELLLKEQYQ